MGQQFPTFLASVTGSLENGAAGTEGGERGDGSGSNVSIEEQ